MSRGGNSLDNKMVYTLCSLLVIIQLVESEMVSRNCHSRCKEQGIAYYRFNPKLEQVAIYKHIYIIS